MALEAPEAHASTTDRLAAYEALRPIAEKNTVRVVGTRVVNRRTDFMLLANGKRVYHPEDLLPLVDSDSPTARAAARARRARGRAETATIIGTIVLIAALAPFAFTDQISSRDLLISTSLGSAAATGAGLAALYYDWRGGDERATAFAFFDGDLRAHLSLCVDGLRLVDCATANASSARGP